MTTHIRIKCTHYHDGHADWEARCDCGNVLYAADWEGCMTWALGHPAFAHSARELGASQLTDAEHNNSEGPA